MEFHQRMLWFKIYTAYTLYKPEELRSAEVKNTFVDYTLKIIPHEDHKSYTSDDDAISWDCSYKVLPSHTWKLMCWIVTKSNKVDQQKG